MTVHLRLGLPDGLRDQAAALYWQAFGGKLGAVMGPTPHALRYLARVIRADHCIVALDPDGGLMGLAGFKTPDGSFAGGSLADMRRVYGVLGMCWRASLLSLLSREVDNDRFLLDGICVAADHRSTGVGSALLAAIENQARLRGYGYVRLDVIDSNWRARALYERQGYMVIKTDSIGPLRHVFGFASALTMVKPIRDAS